MTKYLSSSLMFKNVDWRKAIIQSAVFSIIAIGFPIIALIFNFNPLQPVNAKGFPVTAVLQNSNNLLIAQVSGLTSLLSAGLDIVMDMGAQNDSMSGAVRLKERIFVFMGLAVFGGVFLLCRPFNCILHVYVALNNFKNITLIAAVYSSIYPELCSKKDSFLTFSITLPTILWIFMNLVGAYSVYYNRPGVTSLLNLFYTVLYLLLISSFFRWVQLVRRQNKGRFQLNILTVDEYTFLQYITPALLYPTAIMFWTIAAGGESWNALRAITLIYYVAVSSLFAVVIIVMPGRTARMIAVLNMGLLSLKQVFVRYVSHEIRSPLNIVHAGLDILQSEIDANSGAPVVFISPETAKMVRNMFAASETAIHILNDLLHYEHMDAGTFKLELSVHPLMKFLGKNMDWVKMLAEDKNIEVIVEDNTANNSPAESGADSGDIEHGPALALDEPVQQDAFLNVDMYRVDQVVRNLVTNAIKFTPTNGTVTIKCTTELLGASNESNIVSRVGVDAIGILRVDVTDTGVGIALEDQDRVFGEFNQFDRNNLQGGGGSGLGLWISRRIVHMHKGQMGFSSAGRDQGTTFYFELPLYSAASVGLDPEQAARIMLLSQNRLAATLVRQRRSFIFNNEDSRIHPFESISINESQPIMRFLIVDDSAMNRKMIAKIISGEKHGQIAGAALLEADDGVSAVETLRAEMAAGRKIDFVLMDFVMMKLHGPDAAAVMRKELKYSGTIIGVTGNALPEDIARFMAHGVDEVVVKPLTKAKLLDAIARYMQS